MSHGYRVGVAGCAEERVRYMPSENKWRRKPCIHVRRDRCMRTVFFEKWFNMNTRHNALHRHATKWSCFHASAGFLLVDKEEKSADALVRAPKCAPAVIYVYARLIPVLPFLCIHLYSRFISTHTRSQCYWPRAWAGRQACASTSYTRRRACMRQGAFFWWF